MDQSGHIRAASDHECETDDEALNAGEALVADGGEAEVWQATRRVGVVGEKSKKTG
jgi:hypothetical protein